MRVIYILLYFIFFRVEGKGNIFFNNYKKIGGYNILFFFLRIYNCWDSLLVLFCRLEGMKIRD